MAKLKSYFAKNWRVPTGLLGPRSWRKLSRNEEGKEEGYRETRHRGLVSLCLSFFYRKRNIWGQNCYCYHQGMITLTTSTSTEFLSVLLYSISLSLTRSQAKSQVKDFWDRSVAKPESLLSETLHREGNEWSTQRFTSLSKVPKKTDGFYMLSPYSAPLLEVSSV